jgi:AraC-like DNA-binding protein
MFGGLYVSGALTGLLRDYLDSEGLEAATCRQRLAVWPVDSRMPLAEWIALLDLVAAEDHRPALGLAIGQRVQPRHAGVMGYLGLSCETMGEALWRFERYHRLVYDGNPIQMNIDADSVSISWGIVHGCPGQLADETAIAAFTTITRKLVNAQVMAKRVEFVNAQPPYLQPYTDFFQCPVSFGHERTTVVFSSDYLNLPIRFGDSGLRALLEQQAEALLRTLPENDEFEHHLKQALVKSLHSGEPTLNVVASALHVSARTLQRRLAERDLHFHSVLETTRLALARDYMSNSTLSLTEIALLLGYSEQSAFTRAFKRWTGLTPRQARK